MRTGHAGGHEHFVVVRPKVVILQQNVGGRRALRLFLQIRSIAIPVTGALRGSIGLETLTRMRGGNGMRCSGRGSCGANGGGRLACKIKATCGGGLFEEAVTLEGTQVRDGIPQDAVEALFLQVEIAELTLMSDERVGLDEGGAGEAFVEVREVVGDGFELGQSEDIGFERGDAVQAPVGIGDELGELIFECADGFEFAADGGGEVLVGLHVFGGEDDGSGGEAMLECV